ncbi:hypothetical protein Leryth_015251 [Lithospermum erythrorhizon]|nr:hypothetical protein Leryth_015251 [Lithospermum erythrorhizon]
MDPDLCILWAEQTLIEDNFVLDILFIAYCEFLHPLKGKQWKKLILVYKGVTCDSYNFGKLAISTEVIHSISHAKATILLILIETLDLESLLQMIHDNISFRQGSVAFTLSDIQEIDAIISGVNPIEREVGPILLAWATFLCLISSLPDKPEDIVPFDIDHVGYVHQAIEGGCLKYFLQILESDILGDLEGPVAGYRSVVRTLISSFIAAYEIGLQSDDTNLSLILEILHQIYRGEESLCTQFWDRDSFVDGPIRCLLYNLEREFPVRAVELVHLLSALCEGAWPSECVFNFLEKSVGLSSLFDLNAGTMVDEDLLVLENCQNLAVPGAECLTIPMGTRGRVLKMVDRNIALVRWERTHSGMLVLLLHFAQGSYMENQKEVLVILDLLSRLATFNMDVCYALMNTGRIAHDQVASTHTCAENYQYFDVVELLSTSLKNLQPSCSGVELMSMGVKLLAKMLKCLPSRVSAMVVKANIFDLDLKTGSFGTSSNTSSRGSWMLSGRLDKMLLIDCEHNCSMLTLSVLDFTMELVEVGPENDVVFELIVFSLQYVMVNHEFWKYKVKHTRYNVAIKVLELFKKCILLIPYRPKLSEFIQNIILRDYSVHNALFRIICTSTEDLEILYVSRLHDQMDIEGLQEAVQCGLDVLSSMLSSLQQDLLDIPAQHVIFSPMMKPILVVAAVVSLISCFHDPKMQLGAVRLLSTLCAAAGYLQGSTCLSMDDKQICNLSNSINRILCETSLYNEDLIIATFKLLTSTAQYQPALLVSMMNPMEDSSAQVGNVNKQQPSQPDELFSNNVNLVDAILIYIKRSDALIKSKPIVVLNLLEFLKSLWHGASEFLHILEQLRKFETFWKLLSDFIIIASEMQEKLSENPTEVDIQNIACMYQCQSDIFELMAYEGFTQRKLATSESTVKQTSKGAQGSAILKVAEGKRLHGLKDIFSSWCKGKFFGDVIKSFASCKYDSSARLRANTSICLFLVDAMRKLKSGEYGRLSISLVEKISTLLQKLKSLPVFIELAAHYAEHGYSKVKDAHDLVIDDLFHHLQGEFEGRQIDHRSFKDLSQHLKDTNFIQAYQHMRDDVLLSNGNHLYLYDLSRLQADIGVRSRGFSEWKDSKSTEETMLCCLQDVNLAILLESSKISALNSLVTMLSVHEQEVKCEEAVLGPIFSSCVGNASLNLIITVDSLAPGVDAGQDLVYILVAQAEVILLLIKLMRQSISASDSALVLRSSGYALKELCTFKSDARVRSAIKVLLMLVLLSVELSSDTQTEATADSSNVSLGLLPILCNCIELSDCCSLSLTAIDLIVNAFSNTRTWFPVIQKHLPFRYVIQKLQGEGVSAEISVILKFLLTLARVKEGADMILNSGFLASLKVLLAYLSSDGLLPVTENEGCLTNVLDKTRKPHHIWGLSLAVAAAVVCSLGEGPSNDIAEYVMFYLFVEKAHLINFFLKAPGFPYGDHDKKRARAMMTSTSLSTLKDTEETVMLMCVLAKYRNSWIKVMKEVDSQLRERVIHLLAFISRPNQYREDSCERLAPLLCHPILKEELEWYRQSSFVDSKNGWFSVSPLGSKFDPNLSSLSSNNMNLVVKDQNNQDANSALRTRFSEIAAIQIYRITFFLLQFLCIQAKGAAKRAEEVGFVDLAHFPELPMPDILHGLQDQGLTIVTELCEANKSKQVASEIQEVCLLLLQITEMALYLEHCVVQNCDMRPVSGRMEVFAKEISLLVKASSAHAFLRQSIGSLKQIVFSVYPLLVHSEASL